MNVHRHVNTWQPARVSSADVRDAFEHLFRQHDASEAASQPSLWQPRVDVHEDERQFVLRADIPGVDPALIEVSMDKGVLSISGERVGEQRSTPDRVSRIERATGRFLRQFSLPDSADAEGIVANGKFGTLEILIPKKAQATPRRITINASH